MMDYIDVTSRRVWGMTPFTSHNQGLAASRRLSVTMRGGERTALVASLSSLKDGESCHLPGTLRVASSGWAGRGCLPQGKTYLQLKVYQVILELGQNGPLLTAGPNHISSLPPRKLNPRCSTTNFGTSLIVGLHCKVGAGGIVLYLEAKASVTVCRECSGV